MRFAMYRRVSTMKQADGFSLEDQASVLADLAATYGVAYHDYCDIGRSGESLTERPQLAELLGRLDEYDAVRRCRPLPRRAPRSRPSTRYREELDQESNRRPLVGPSAQGHSGLRAWTSPSRMARDSLNC